MLKIGDFSTLSKISIYMLRNYDKMGLLVPAHIDKDSGYRYYEENQLAVANRIQALKAMGLGLESIKEIISQYSNAESLVTYLGVQAAIKREELEAMKLRLHQLETTIESLQRNRNILRYSIEVKEIPKRTVAYTRSIIPAYDKEGELWETLFEVLRGQKIQTLSPSYNLAVFHGEGFMENNIDVEVQNAVSSIGKDTERVKFKIVEPVIAAVITYEGEYSRISEMSGLLADWVQDNRYSFCGPHFNIYHNSPATENSADKMVTEVGFPIRKL